MPGSCSSTGRGFALGFIFRKAREKVERNYQDFTQWKGARSRFFLNQYSFRPWEERAQGTTGWQTWEHLAPVCHSPAPPLWIHAGEGSRNCRSGVCPINKLAFGIPGALTFSQGRAQAWCCQRSLFTEPSHKSKKKWIIFSYESTDLKASRYYKCSSKSLFKSVLPAAGL